MKQEVREIWPTTGVQGFEGQVGMFKPYTPFDREPVELEYISRKSNKRDNLLLFLLSLYEGDEALVSCGIMESLIRVINWYDTDEGQDHITVSFCTVSCSSYFYAKCYLQVLRKAIFGTHTIRYQLH